MRRRLDEAARLLSAMAMLAPSVITPSQKHAGIRATELVVQGGINAPSLRVLAFPQDYVELVPSDDATSWARCSGSRQRPKRFGDDRATLTMCSCTRISVGVHWVTHGGEEKTQPNAVSPPFSQSGTIETWVGH